MLRLLVLTLILSACKAGTDSKAHQKNHQNAGDIPYTIARPDQTFNLSKELNEISGLSFHENQIIAVNDEVGKIYSIDPANGKITNDRRFGKAGDYEGIASTGTDIFIAKSNGKLYKATGSKKSKIYDTILGAENEVEGLCYDQKTKQLLMACKGSPNVEKDGKYKHQRAIYYFDPLTKDSNPEPAAVISNDSMTKWYGIRNNLKKKDNVTQMRARSRLQGFSPSAIDINPITKNIYLLSSRGKSLLVIEPSGIFVDLILLDEVQHNQPEGLCFDTEGNLFISNEGKHLTPKMYRYNYKGNK